MALTEETVCLNYDVPPTLRPFAMARARVAAFKLNVWPAFTDTMLAFVLVLVLMLVFQVGRAVDVVGSREVVKDQERIEQLVLQQDNSNVKILRGLGRHDITFGAEVIFPSGSAELNERGRSILAELAQSVARRQIRTLQEIQVSGHTDNVPTQRARFATNWELSTARATGIVRFLIDSGIDPVAVRLSATGYGEYAPVEANDTDNARAANRRIEMRLIYSEKAE